MKYYLESLGCAKNLVDSERFAAILDSYQIRETFEIEEADIVLVNSCAFLQSALGELDDTLCEILYTKKGDKYKLIVTGCVTTRELDNFKENFREVNKWIMLKDFDGFEKYLKRYVLAPQAIALPVPKRHSLSEGQFTYLRIADGCDNHCSYCMIPSIRGPLKSVPIEELVSEAKAISVNGQELCLIAQDTCMYGVDIYGEKALPRLIEELLKLDAYKWIRVLYLHPDHFEMQWLQLWKKYPQLLPYFEIPIQHVSPRLIGLMNRKKSYHELKALFHGIKEEIPTAVFRTTLMVGYPSETKEDQELLDRFLAETDILHAGAFAYSPEKESLGYFGPMLDFDWRGQYDLELSWAEKLSQQKEKKLEKLIGQRFDAIVEGYDHEEGTLYGRLWFQAPEVDGTLIFEGKPKGNDIFVKVEIVHALPDAVIGRFV